MQDHAASHLSVQRPAVGKHATDTYVDQDTMTIQSMRRIPDLLFNR